VQEVALVDDQAKVAVRPLWTVLGDAVNVTEGVGCVTETVTDCAALPPAPVHVKVYVVFAESAPEDWVPLTALLPDQAPDAVHAVACAEDQLSVALLPAVTVLGLAVNVTVGMGGVTDTVAVCEALPPAPLQVKT
jgi:hypothetical protein